MALKSRLKPAARYLAKSAFALADFPFRERPGPRILIYHQVGSSLGRQMEVTTRSFEFQLEWLLGNGSVVSLSEAIDRRAEPDAHRLYTLTFDDGYRDVYENALPLLRDAAVPFTIYVTTQPVESGRPTTPGGQADPLTWSQLAEMADLGATIGSHTHTHPDLRSLTESQIEAEVETSDRLIRERLGIESRHFCYPYGFWSAPADRVLREHYESATLGGGPPVVGNTDPFRIHRVPVQLSDNHLFFVRKMKSGMVAEEAVRRRINGYRGVNSD